MTADQAGRKMARRQQRVETEFKATMRGVGVSALKFCKEKLTTEIYAIPEDRTKAGKQKWRRTGHLRRSEKFEVRGPYSVAIVNTAEYAKARHEYGKAPTPAKLAELKKKGKEPAKFNPLRVSHWHDEMRAVFHEELLKDLYRQTLLAALKD